MPVNETMKRAVLAERFSLRQVQAKGMDARSGKLHSLCAGCGCMTPWFLTPGEDCPKRA